MKRKVPSKTICSILLVLLAAATVATQSYQIAFQGSLSNSGMPANGNYDFEFVVFDSLNGGIQITGVQARNNVAVSNGVFAVKLDFGSVFPGANRFLEIRVRPTGQPGMTVLTPRQQIDSSPYAIKSLTADNANTVGGQTAASVANAVIAVNSATPANTPNTLVMRTANGDLSAATIFATQQYNIGAFRVLGINGPNNIFVGVNAGASNTTGGSNAFFGSSAGQSNTTGSNNSFFGMRAGFFNSTGGGNAFFGNEAGESNTSGAGNTFVGHQAGAANSTANFNTFTGQGAGAANTTGSFNTFTGSLAGAANTTGLANTFIGRTAGNANTTGSDNTFMGAGTGAANTTGFDNTFIGRSAGLANTTGIGNTFIGSTAGDSNTTANDNSFFGFGAGRANTTGANNSFFGRTAGATNTTGMFNSFFGSATGSLNNSNNNAFFGHAAGTSNQTGHDNAFFGYGAGNSNTEGANNSFFGTTAGLNNLSGSNNTLLGAFANVSGGPLNYATAIGAGAVVSTSATLVLGRTEDIVRIPGFLRVVQLGSPGSTSLCQNVNDTISTCSSSIRYKSNVNGFTAGLSLIDRLRPVSFNWKDGGMLDMGLVAEEVAEIEPLLVTTNKQGLIEGVKYDRVGVVLVNAVKEQQTQIEEHRKTIERQQQQIDALMKLVCATNASAEICKEEK